MRDSVSFSGAMTVIRPVKNKEEIKELLTVFFKAIKHNLEPDKKTPAWLEKIDKYLSLLPFYSTTKLPNNITEVVKHKNKVAGGYSICVNTEKQSAHIGFITLAPEYMKTKSGIAILKGIPESICQNAEVNNIKELTWTTNTKNKQINRILNRFSPEKVRSLPLGETEYKISLESFKQKLNNL